MSPLLRWGKFNLVGAVGVGLQLSMLAILQRVLRGHYLIASAVAVELTIVHNFFWHLHFTWKDRRGSRLSQFMRFQLSNGTVSLIGNLLLMKLLVQELRLPVVAANLASILICSLANYSLANRWVFGKRLTQVAAGVVLLFALPEAHSQTTDSSSLPDAPTVTTAHTTLSGRTLNDSKATYVWNAGVFCGMGASASEVSTKPTFGCGAGFTFIPYFLFVEAGVMGPQAHHSNVSGYLSLDSSLPLASNSATYRPFAILGYSRLFETGHALDYGIALALPRSSKPGEYARSYRLELRDYYTFANPNQHNVMLRFGWMSPAAD